MTARRCVVGNAALLGTALLLAACGSGGNEAVSEPNGPAELSGTLAYVTSACRTAPDDGVVIQETLRVRRGGQPPVDITRFELHLSEAFTTCAVFARLRIYGSPTQVAFSRLAVSPDGERLVFELSDDFSLLLHDALDPEAEGFFVVDTDGSGPRRLGPPSREPAYFVSHGAIFNTGDFQFTPDGHAVVFVDKGPGPGGEEATQIVLIDLATGLRRQLTALPLAVPGPDAPPGVAPVGLLTFVDDTTLAFLSTANPDGLNPRGDITGFTVRTDGSGRIEGLPAATLVPGGQIDPRFRITGARPRAGIVVLPGVPVGPPSNTLLGIEEVFLRDGDNLLQLTNFQRGDTFAVGPLTGDGQRVVFTASADPLGTNPTNNCQLFSVDRFGGDLRQITRFGEGRASLNGCTIFFAKPFGCNVDFQAEDALTQSLLFVSTCDPFGTNPDGSQLFAVRPDGTGLRQLTNFSGLVFEAGAGSAEGPGSFAFASQPPGH